MTDARSCLHHAPDHSGYERVGRWEGDGSRATAVPFSASEPLLFHVLTGLPGGRAGDQALLDMVAAGVELAPPRHTERSRQLMYPRDVVAGDDAYLFLSALNTFRIRFPSEGIEPALAFDAAALWDASEDGFAFRVHDSEGIYKSIEDTVEPWSVLPEDDGDEPPWESWTEDEQKVYLEEQTAETCRESLECAAELGTQSDPEKAWELLALHVKLAAGLVAPEEGWPTARDLTPDEPHYEECPEAWALEEAWGQLFDRDEPDLREAVWSVGVGHSPENPLPRRASPLLRRVLAEQSR